MEALRNISFVDLYIGDGYADIKPFAGAHVPRSAIPSACHADSAALAQAARSKMSAERTNECTIRHDGVAYRVARMPDQLGKDVLFCRRVEDRVLPLQELGLPDDVVAFLLRASTQGLVLVAGAKGSGKTATAAAIMVARTAALGGFGLALEDPNEISIDGVHGDGRIIQVAVGAGEYPEKLFLGARTGVDATFIGEVRCKHTGASALTLANSQFVISTIHARSIEHAIAQLEMYASQGGVDLARWMIAEGISAVIHQTIERFVRGGKTRVLVKHSCLLVEEGNRPVRIIIKEKGELHGLRAHVESQQKRRERGG